MPKTRQSRTPHLSEQPAVPASATPRAHAAYAPAPWVPAAAGARQDAPRRMAGLLELGASATGLGLAFFMIMHLGLLSTAHLGESAMNAVAGFMERYYLLQITVPALVLALAAHILLAARKVPTSAREQWMLLREMKWLKHLDTWTWAFQVFTGVAILALIAIHMWVVVTDIPVQAEKSGARVFGVYLWFYIPFILLVQAHTYMGVYRIAVKWGLLSRRSARIWITALAAVIVGLSLADIATFFAMGARQ